MLGSCTSPPTLLDRILEQGELKVLTQNSPTTYYYGADEVRGIEYELAQGFAERLGVILKIELADRVWELLPEVASGKAHIGAAGLSVTDLRRTVVAFGPPYQTVEPELVYRMGARRPRSISDLPGGALEIEAGSGHASILTSARQLVPALEWTERSDLSAEGLVRRVAQGEIDYAVVDSNEFALLRQYYPEARAAFGLGAKTELAWALPKDAQSLREEVAAYFAEIEANGKLARILDRYYYASRDFDFVGSRTFVRQLYSRLPQYQTQFVAAGLETGIDWRVLAAIAYQESHWNPKAVSPTGVRGLMMLTEHTASIVNVSDRSDPGDSILGGARYLRRVLDKFPDRIPYEDRLWLAVAAYNIGFGHVEDARIITEMQGGNPDSWDDVSQRLPLLSDEAWFSRVRRGFAQGSVPVLYVDNVRRYYSLLDWIPGSEVVSAARPPAATTG
jgi:peptidoglycan lytic transglycosylase F